MDGNTRALVGEVFSALEDHDLERFRSLLHKDALMKNPATGAVHRGAEAISEALRPVLRAFPDLTPEVKDVVVDEDQAAVEVVRVGTHTAELELPAGTIPPTNQEVELAECLILEQEEGKVASITAYSDRQMLTEQLNLENNAA